MQTDSRLHKIQLESGLFIYINTDDVRDFYNKEGQTFLETVGGVIFKVFGAPDPDTFYNNTFIVKPTEITITNSPVILGGTVNTIDTDLAMTANQLSVTVANSSVTIFNANVNRKKMMFRNYGDDTKNPIFVRFGTGAANGNGVPLISGETYIPPDGTIHTGFVTAFYNASSGKVLYAEEWS